MSGLGQLTQRGTKSTNSDVGRQSCYISSYPRIHMQRVSFERVSSESYHWLNRCSAYNTPTWCILLNFAIIKVPLFQSRMPMHIFCFSMLASIQPLLELSPLLSIFNEANIIYSMCRSGSTKLLSVIEELSHWRYLTMDIARVIYGQTPWSWKAKCGEMYSSPTEGHAYT